MAFRTWKSNPLIANKQPISVQGNFFRFDSIPSGNVLTVESDQGETWNVVQGRNIYTEKGFKSLFVSGYAQVPGPPPQAETLEAQVGYGWILDASPSTVDVVGPEPSGTPIPAIDVRPLPTGIWVPDGNGNYTPWPWASLDTFSGLISEMDRAQALIENTQIALTVGGPGGFSWLNHSYSIIQVNHPGAWDGTLDLNMGMSNGAGLIVQPRLFTMAGAVQALPLAANTKGYFYMLTGGFPFLSSIWAGGVTPPIVQVVSVHGPIPVNIP